MVKLRRNKLRENRNFPRFFQALFDYTRAIFSTRKRGKNNKEENFLDIVASPRPITVRFLSGEEPIFLRKVITIQVLSWEKLGRRWGEGDVSFVVPTSATDNIRRPL